MNEKVCTTSQHFNVACFAKQRAMLFFLKSKIVDVEQTTMRFCDSLEISEHFSYSVLYHSDSAAAQNCHWSGLSCCENMKNEIICSNFQISDFLATANCFLIRQRFRLHQVSSALLNRKLVVIMSICGGDEQVEDT